LAGGETGAVEEGGVKVGRRRSGGESVGRSSVAGNKDITINAESGSRRSGADADEAVGGDGQSGTSGGSASGGGGSSQVEEATDGAEVPLIKSGTG